MIYSVLMSVYCKENALFFDESIKSIFNQTIVTDDFVLVCDGPLTNELEQVIKTAKEDFQNRMHIIRLKNNHGLGYALNVGLKKCKNELVARMDSDDIAFPDRCEKQLNIFEKNANIDIVSGAVTEFNVVPGDLESRRVPPKMHNEIIEFAKKRNPFNHPCVMYKKSKVMEAGGYKSLFLLEDYYLWIRMLLNSAKGYNIQDTLLYMRVGNGMYKRRSGIKHVRSQIWLFRFMYEKRFITLRACLKACFIRTVGSLMPNALRKIGYKFFLR